MELQTDSRMIDWMRAVRRRLHSSPELAYQERGTADFLAGELRKLGVEHQTGIAGTGIVAVINGQGSDREGAPCVALRADMDAIPLQEATGLPFASVNPGVMHACGHDGHMAMLLGATALLQRTPVRGRVKLFFQPAEERGNGAEKMIKEGVLDDVCMIFSGHIDIHYPVGIFTVDEGLICSYTDPFTITVRGRGGHAAWPHEAIDSVVVASNLIMSMQTLVSREIDPTFPAVVTVGRVSAGTVHNVIAEQAVIDGTVRSAHPQTRQRILDGLQRMIQGVGAMSGATITMQLLDGLPAVINDGQAAELARDTARAMLGDRGVISQGRPSLGGEDFAFYLQRIPGCMVRFGAGLGDRQPGLAHSSRFDFDEGVLPLGAAWLAGVAGRALERLGAEEEESR
jgi:hippurate hydrolase